MKNKELIDENNVIAFNSWQRWFHIHLIHFVALFILTGLPILSTSFSFLGEFYQWVYGVLTSKETTYSDGIAFAQMLHRCISIFFMITIIPFAVVMLKEINNWHIFPEKGGTIAEGVKQLNIAYLEGKHAKFGKFNMGQKLMTWTMISAVSGLVISGIMLMGHYYIDLARLLHVVAFAGMIIALIFHIHFATLPMNRKAFRAMFRDGKLPMEEVKKHHPLWYKKLKK
ncbi:cytochrome b/b6 domain-containing protein [Vibrio sp. SS-MA-C1-2]|uniref:cytochrome b/b6 domain-containing protein n=1 Tax=Vibrio sp. SS-MA-C1-2 TaxID=2908646 RepID=UPI001F183700|nr:cytochrome b/b6 domain-containing protein [Vibrio sp. SS-MA-C1-2]UJF17041.1 cytochrome b/b6 domain-containing protein [Vibrio sp. SS-MA-C1-2]